MRGTPLKRISLTYISSVQGTHSVRTRGFIKTFLRVTDPTELTRNRCHDSQVNFFFEFFGLVQEYLTIPSFNLNEFAGSKVLSSTAPVFILDLVCNMLITISMILLVYCTSLFRSDSTWLRILYARLLSILPQSFATHCQHWGRFVSHCYQFRLTHLHYYLDTDPYIVS